MYEDSNLKTDCQISEDLKNRLSWNHYIKCFCFNQNVASKNTNIDNEKHKLTSNIKQVCAQSVNKITMRKINNTRIFVNEVENSI
jgi:hypothetical protein